MPRTAGSIQICRKCTPSVGDGLNSLCMTPRPALMRCTSPGTIVEPVPMLSVRELPFEHVADDLHVAVAVRAEAHARLHAVLVDDAQRAEAHVRGIVVVGEAEAVERVEPAVVGVAALGRPAQRDHAQCPNHRAPPANKAAALEL